MLLDSHSISLETIWEENKKRYPDPVERENAAESVQKNLKTLSPETPPQEPPAKGKGKALLVKKFGNTSAEIILRHFDRFELRICCFCTPAG